jgi:hypothetical protein
MMLRKKIPPEKFTAYYNVLDACKVEGCIICNLVKQTVALHIDGLLYENVNDPDTRKTLRAALGFCTVHAKALISAGDAYGISILYADVISVVNSALQKRSFDMLHRHEPCPLCTYRKSFEEHYGKTISDHLHEQELQDAIARSSGFCLVHLRMVEQQLSDDTQRRWLRALQAEKIEVLQHTLNEFIRKHEARFSGEKITTSEQNSCTNAIQMIVGTIV